LGIAAGPAGVARSLDRAAHRLVLTRVALATPTIAVLTIPKRGSLLTDGDRRPGAPLGLHAERTAKGRGASMAHARRFGKQKVSWWNSSGPYAVHSFAAICSMA